MFRATVRSFVEKEVMPHVEAWETAGRMPKAIFRRMGELGFLGLEYDERYGGAGADVMMTAVLHEECARSEERRVGKECRGRWAACPRKKKKKQRARTQGARES